jgi:hypothetical protein
MDGTASSVSSPYRFFAFFSAPNRWMALFPHAISVRTVSHRFLAKSMATNAETKGLNRAISINASRWVFA